LPELFQINPSVPKKMKKISKRYVFSRISICLIFLLTFFLRSNVSVALGSGPILGGEGDNNPPIANNDSYRVNDGVTLTVGATRDVLVNDSDPDGDLITAVLVSGPSNGRLDFCSDGYFSYCPDPGFTGTDSFTYHAEDDVGDFDVAIVPVTVMPSGPPTFTDITSSSGTGGPDRYGGHGVQFVDVTGDGLPDLYVTMNFRNIQDMAELFYRNIDGTTFGEEAMPRGIDNIDSGSHGGVWADLDNDGDYDLFNGAYVRNRIYRNNGLGFFTDVTDVSGIPDRLWPTRAVLAFDMDNDGDLDLFAVSGAYGSGDPLDEVNEVYSNDGNMKFAAIDSGALFTAPVGQGATDSDFDGDGDIDILAGNRNGDVNILRNDGSGNFEMITPDVLGINHSADDGITLSDVDNDGHLDVLLQKHLYTNNGDNTYTFSNTFSASGYMGGFEDLDNDGDWDLVFSGDNKVYLNNGSGNFIASPPFSVGTVKDPRCVAFADIDDDGDIDIFYAQKRAYNRMIRNDYDGTNKWLKVCLLRDSGQAGAFGAKVYIFQANQVGNEAARITWREARSQEGYLGQNDPVLHFGAGKHNVVDVRVVFLGGITLDLSNVLTSQTIVVKEPEASVSHPPTATMMHTSRMGIRS